METSRRRFYQISAIVVFVTASLIIGFLALRHKVNQKVLIGREQAIQNAVQACPAHGLQPVEQPTEFQTELTTYEKASNYLTNPLDAEKPVWVVTMKGRWLLVGGPPLAFDPSNPTPEPVYWDECTIIIDAETGESLSSPIE